ncbi:MAG: hypothetical protein ABI402_16200 [Ferruginibacter sp.]
MQYSKKYQRFNKQKTLCIKKDILATLAYFDMFDYPLKKRELFIFLQQPAENREFETAIDFLLNESIIYKLNEFYSLTNNFLLVERRFNGNARAEALLKKANAGAKLLSKFPYVRGVAISGSLSKNFADETADVDFFIITAENRLWIARSFLHIFKKFTFLFNKQHMYCMNYFIDETEPGIVEKNIYTATEIATLLPLYGSDTFEKFYSANDWTKAYLPNHYMRISSAKQIKAHWFKFIVEKIFNNAVGNLFDNFLMKLTAKSWASKTRRRKKNSRGILMALDTSKHFAKPNPLNFQQKLLKRYENRLAEIFDNYENIFPVTVERIK